LEGKDDRQIAGQVGGFRLGLRWTPGKPKKKTGKRDGRISVIATKLRKFEVPTKDGGRRMGKRIRREGHEAGIKSSGENA